jgi:hypothetical protein
MVGFETWPRAPPADAVAFAAGAGSFLRVASFLAASSRAAASRAAASFCAAACCAAAFCAASRAAASFCAASFCAACCRRLARGRLACLRRCRGFLRRRFLRCRFLPRRFLGRSVLRRRFLRRRFAARGFRCPEVGLRRDLGRGVLVERRRRHARRLLVLPELPGVADLEEVVVERPEIDVLLRWDGLVGLLLRHTGRRSPECSRVPRHSIAHPGEQNPPERRIPRFV